MMMPRTTLIGAVGLLTCFAAAVAAQAAEGRATAAVAANVVADAPQAIAKDAYIYGYPVVDAYNVLYNYSLDPASPEYKGRLNAVHHTRNVATPRDRAIIAPNVDTPYSHAWFDLRAEPLVLTIPAFEPNRYVSLQLFDLYSYITGYVTPRTNGNRGGRFLLTGPGWKGVAPPGIDGVFESTTWLGLGLYRTQLFDKADLPRVHAIQDGFKVTPLSGFLRQPPPPPKPPLAPVTPVNLRTDPTSLRFFDVLDWMLQYMPALPEDSALRHRMQGIGIHPGRPFAAPAGSAPLVKSGMEAGLAAMRERATQVRSSSELFGSRAYLGTDYLVRATGAMLGIFGNAAEEYLGVGYQADSEGRPFNGAHRYRIRFAPGALPPVGAFWSITVYDADRLLYANTIDRYVINSPMLPTLKRDLDGGITLHIQHADPGPALHANWLPVPPGDFGLTFRTYQPTEAIRNGAWRAPPVAMQ
jgi:hypothetical protein